MKYRHILTLMVIGAVWLTYGWTVGLAEAQAVTVQLGSEATLIERGQAVLLPVQVSCPKKYVTLEAFVYVTQDGNTSQFAGIPLVCEKKLQTFIVRVPAFEEAPFHTGAANATAYVLLEHPKKGDTLQGGDTRPITIR